MIKTCYEEFPHSLNRIRVAWIFGHEKQNERAKDQK